MRASLALVADGAGLGTDQELRDALQLVAQELTASGLLP
jgi:hypothetical protein